MVTSRCSVVVWFSTILVLVLHLLLNPQKLVESVESRKGQKTIIWFLYVSVCFSPITRSPYDFWLSICSIGSAKRLFLMAQAAEPKGPGGLISVWFLALFYVLGKWISTNFVLRRWIYSLFWGGHGYWCMIYCLDSSFGSFWKMGKLHGHIWHHWPLKIYADKEIDGQIER